MKKRLFFLLFLLKMTVAPAQDLTQIRSAKPVQLSGYLGASSYFYDGDRSTTPFGWSMSGSVTLNFYGVFSVPVNLQISDRQLNYNLPVFRRFGLSPTWKWLKLHGGYRNMTFSPYTLAGFTFLGGGVEMNPGKFRFAAMRGKLDQTFIFPTENLVVPGSELKLFDRWATGVKIGVGTDRNFFDLFFIKVKDKSGTGDIDSLARLYIHPQENLVVGSAFKFTFFKRLTLEANGAASGVTENQNAIELPIDTAISRSLRSFSNLLTINSSSRYAFAGDAAASIRIGPVTVGGKIQQVDPFFKSFGAYYILTDFQNRLVNGSVSLGRGKASLSGSLGFQRDNLKGYLDRTSRRRIGSASAQFLPKKGFSIGLQFSNFNTDQRADLVQIGDSLRVATTTLSGSMSSSYSWKKGDKTHHISASGGLSRFFDARTNEPLNNKNVSLSYRIKLKTKGFSVKTGLNGSAFNQANLLVQRIGLLLGGDKEFGKKSSLGLQTNFSKNNTGGQADGFLLRTTLSFRYQPRKKHSINGSLNWNLRRTEVLRPLNEWQGRVGYSVQF